MTTGQDDEALESLQVRFMDQGSLEHQIETNASKLMKAREDELDDKRLNKTKTALDKVDKRLRILNQRAGSRLVKISEKENLQREISLVVEERSQILKDFSEISQRKAERNNVLLKEDSSSHRLPDETEREFLIRTGEITAFGSSNKFSQKEIVDDDVVGEDEKVGEDMEDDEYKENESENLSEDSEEIAQIDSFRNIDDGDELIYKKRLQQWSQRRNGGDFNTEYLKPHPTVADATLDKEYKMPGDIYPLLFDYQKTCVQWLYELYCQKTGGIVGDEMGLGKTIQVIAFLAGLHHSKKLDKPILIVCPATVLRQWCNEFHKWWPAFRTVILHSIGSGMTNGTVQQDEELESMMMENDYQTQQPKSHESVKKLVDRVFEKGHVIITTYVGLRIYSKQLLTRSWGYAVLDEGHKIRNPNSDISLTAKQLKTHNRIILSGTPIQNNLTELWSLFDFIFPGRLGTLPVFQQQFSVPINVGGYANATNVQVQTGYKCAVVLRDLISPYLLRRVKSDVAKDLPKKKETVLFCKLTQYQQDLYETFLKSDEMSSILNGKRQVLYGIDILRKICNHPDLSGLDLKFQNHKPQFGAASRSGKMHVLRTLLELWVSQNHKVLVFTQTRQMLDILEKFISKQFKYLRMDGATSIGSRQSLVDSFNTDPAYSVFLLTTRVGGLGVNLTGADRVIIYDPDWNPSTDMQARERAWRLGQKREVSVYRLMIAGSIEEKIYHRQIFKQFLTNKILKDPKQKRFFKMNDLHDLFSLGDQNEQGTETGDMFGGGDDSKRENDDFMKVAGISSTEAFKTSEEKSNDEDRIMAGLFADSGVHSTLEHDSIIDSSRPDTVLVEKEATRIAAEAASALKESRKAARKAKIGTPTWTGKFGSAGRFGVKRKANSPASSAILQNMKAKRDLERVPKKRTPNPDNDKLIHQLSEFISNNDGFSTSRQIVDGLELKMSTQQETVLLRSMLKSICVWDDGRKGWVLKEEFR